MYDFGLSLEDAKVAAEWAKLTETFRRQHRHVTRPGAQAWLGRPRSYVWLREALRELSVKKAVESYWRLRTKLPAQTPGERETPVATFKVVKQVRETLSFVLGQEGNLGEGRNYLGRFLGPTLESRSDAEEFGGGQTFSVADAKAFAKSEVYRDLLMIFDYYERPQWFFTDFAPRTFKELIGPKVYPDEECLHVSDPRFKAAVRLGFTLWCFGAPALLNEKARGAFLALASHPEEFGLCMALANGKKAPGSGRPSGSQNSPESTSQQEKMAKLRVYHAITTYLTGGDNGRDLKKATAVLEDGELLELVKGIDGCSVLTAAEARREALNLMIEKIYPGTTKKSLRKIISAEPDFKL